MRQTEMIYHTPPAEWMEGLPIGNGRIAAMVWGESGYDRLTLNHEWLWKGQHRDRRCEDNAAHLPEVRACIERADWQEAAELANRYFGGGGGVTGKSVPKAILTPRSRKPLRGYAAPALFSPISGVIPSMSES